MRSSRAGIQTFWAAACIFLFLTGCGDSGRSVFRRAQQLFRQGQYELALKHYQLITDSYPNSQYADEALFQQGLILTGHMKRPRAALQRFKDLIEKHPDSNLADDALMATGQIHAEAHQYGEAEKVYTTALDKYSENRDVAAEAQLALGRIWFHQGKARAVEAFLATLRDYPDKVSRCAEAQYLLGRCYQEVQRDADRAVKAYQAVLDNYAETQFAEPARQAIGFIYYERKIAEAAQGKRVFLETAASAAEPSHPLIESLQVCLRARGITAPAWQLMGLTGVSFENDYLRDQSAVSSTVQVGNPFEPICAAFGLRYELIEARDAQEAWARLRQTLDEGQPSVALVHASPPRWCAVVGYDQKAMQVFVKGKGAAVRRIAVSDFDKTLLKPPSAILDTPPAAWAKFAFISLSGHSRAAQRRRVEMRSLTTAASVLRGSASEQTNTGLKALEEVESDIQAAANGDIDARVRLLAWAKQSVPRVRSLRRASVTYLRALAKNVRGATGPRISEAADSLAKTESLLAELQGQIESLLSAEAADQDSTAERWQGVLTTVRELIDHQRLAADSLAAAGG